MPLTNAVTVRLGRVLTHRMGLLHIHFPDRTPRPQVALRDCAAGIPAVVAEKVREVHGEFTVTRFNPW